MQVKSMEPTHGKHPLERLEPASGTQAVERALGILFHIAREGGARGVSLMEVSRHLQIHKSTVHRLLSTLVRHSLLHQDAETERYRLGPGALEIGGLYLSSLEVRREAAPYLSELVARANETAHMGVLEDGEVVYVDKIESRVGVHLYSRIGARRPAHASGLGKALLAYSPESEVERVIQRGLSSLTAKTITHPQHLRDALIAVRYQGYAVDDEESREGVRCVAAPVFDHQGRLLVAISLTSIVTRLTDEKLPEFGAMVRDTAEEISRCMGNAVHSRPSPPREGVSRPSS